MNGTRRFVAAALVAVAAVVGVVAASAGNGTGNGTKPPRLQFLGQAIVPTGTTFAGTTVGGLSSISYDASRGAYYALSDDPSQFQPARFYSLGINLADGHLDNGDVAFTGVTTLQAPGGGPYAPFSLDPEGLTLTKDGELIVTSEGIANSGVAPFVRRYSLGGSVPRRPAGAERVPADEPDARRPPEPRLRGGRGRAERPAPLRRHGRRTRAGRPRRDRLERQHVADPPLQPRVRPPRAAGRLRRRPGRGAARAGDELLRQRPRRAAALQRRVHAGDGALVLGRRARHRKHDQALLRLVHAAPRTSTASTASPASAACRPRRRRCCSTCARSASRSTTSRA